MLGLPRLLICTGMLLASMPMKIMSGPGVAVLAKPFCVEDLEAAVEWLRGRAVGRFRQATWSLRCSNGRDPVRSGPTLPIA